MNDEAHKSRVESVFRRYDTDNSGTIDGAELVNALQSLSALPDGSPEAQRQFVDDILARVEPDDDDAGSLTLSEFQKLFDLGRVRAAFKAVDTDGSGNATAAEVAAMLRRLGVRASLADAKKFIARVDSSGDGTIDAGEFEKAFEFVPLASLQAVAERWAALGALPDCGGELGSATIPVPGLRTWQTVMAGGIGGVASRSVVAPLERVRLAQQTGRAEGLGLFGLLRSIVGKEGWLSLWKGNGTACLRVFPTGAITCTSYVNLLKLTPADDEIDAMEPFYRGGAAAGAALIGQVSTYPIEVVRVRVTVAGAPILKVVREVAAEGGVRAFFGGLGPTLAAVVPFVAVQNASIDLGRNTTGHGADGAPSYVHLWLVGAFAGCSAQTFTYPLDVLRRRLQMGSLADEVARGGWAAATRGVVQREGIGSLFAGIGATYLKSVPSVATIATVCVSMNRYFAAQNKTEHEAQFRPGPIINDRA